MGDVFFGDDFLEFVFHFLVIPILFCEKPLYGSNWRVGLEGDGFAVFAREVGDQTVGVDSEVVPVFWLGKQDSNRRSSRGKLVRIEAETVESIQAFSVRAISLYGNILQHFGKNEIEKSLRCSSKVWHRHC